MYKKFNFGICIICKNELFSYNKLGCIIYEIMIELTEKNYISILCHQSNISKTYINNYPREGEWEVIIQYYIDKTSKSKYGLHKRFYWTLLCCYLMLTKVDWTKGRKFVKVCREKAISVMNTEKNKVYTDKYDIKTKENLIKYSKLVLNKIHLASLLNT